MAAVFIAALSVAFTFLATVHWLPLGGEEPAMAAPRGHRAAPGAPHASDGAREPHASQKPSGARTGPRAPVWVHTQPLDYQEAA